MTDERLFRRVWSDLTGWQYVPVTLDGEVEHLRSQIAVLRTRIDAGQPMDPDGTTEGDW